MSGRSELGNMREVSQMVPYLRVIVHKILQDDRHKEMGDINWTTGETWGVLISGAVVGVATVLLFNRYYK